MTSVKLYKKRNKKLDLLHMEEVQYDFRFYPFIFRVFT